jgi:hypothetical protein
MLRDRRRADSPTSTVARLPGTRALLEHVCRWCDKPGRDLRFIHLKRQWMQTAVEAAVRQMRNSKVQFNPRGILSPGNLSPRLGQ